VPVGQTNAEAIGLMMSGTFAPASARKRSARAEAR